MTTVYKNPHAGHEICDVCRKRVRSNRVEKSTDLNPPIAGHLRCVRAVVADPAKLKVVRERQARETQANLLVKDYWNQSPTERRELRRQVATLAVTPDVGSTSRKEERKKK